jgi:triosephosphate isomerase
MKHLIVANWKMNPQTAAEARQLFDPVKDAAKEAGNVEVVICPPFAYLTIFNSQSSVIKLGGQNCFWEEKGAFTGEVSPTMLKDSGCEYVILGHSERRRYFKETDEMVNKKIKAALKNNLKPILCAEKSSQIRNGLKGIPEDEFKNLILAYEPVFAIGTGKPCPPEKAEETRKEFEEIINKEIPVLYGGSVNSQNARDYIEKTGFQGLLVGGASLDAGEFVKLIKNAAGA